MRWAGFWLVAILGWSSFGASQAALVDDPSLIEKPPIVLSKAYWVDTNGQASIEDIQSIPLDQWAPVDGVLSAGYQKSPHWLRLDIGPGELGGRPWVLRMRPAWHDDVRLFDPLLSDQVQIAGDKHPSSNSNHRSVSLVFDVPQAQVPRSLFLRIDSPHSMMVKADLLSWDEMHQADYVYTSWLFAYLAFLFAVLIFSLLVWWSDRERVVAAFCVQLSFSIIYAALMFGVIKLLFGDAISPELLNQMTNVVIVLYPMSVLIFYRVLYTDHGLCRWARLIFDGLIGLSAANFVLLIIGWVPDALKWNGVILLIASLFAMLIPWFALRPVASQSESESESQPALPVWMLRSAGVVLILGAAWGVARTLIDINSDAGFEYFLVHSFVLAVVVASMLQYRARRRLVYLKKDVVLAQQTADQERMGRETLEQFMSMLSHEIKTPLSVVRLAVEDGVKDTPLRMRAVDAVMDIDQLIARCLQSDQVSSGLLQPHTEPVDIQAIGQAVAMRLGANDRVIWRIDGDASVKADAWFVEVILSNLFENALKYGDPTTPIEIQVASSHGLRATTITVSNGLPEAVRFDGERIFEKFYRGEGARRVSGAGLGLYLAKSLAELLGGDLRYNPSSSAHFVLELTLPR